MEEKQDPKPKLKHSEDYTRACNVRQFEDLKKDLVAIIATGKALGLAVSAWEAELKDTEEQIRTLKDLNPDYWGD